MKTLIIGCYGFVGRHLRKAYKNAEGTHRVAKADCFPLDLCLPDLSKLPINWEEYSHAIVTSGVTKISLCEQQPETTYLCNVTGTLKLASQLKDRNIFPIFFSSDYVFDGKNAPYDETSKLNPLNEYGRQKAILERELPQICGNEHLIIRLGKVIGVTPGDRTMLDEMALSLIQGKKVAAAFDQILSPIFIDDAVKGIIALQNLGATGLHQLCGSEIWNRYELAQHLAAALGTPSNLIQKISLDDLGESFQRPKNTSMKNDQFVAKTCLQTTSMTSCINQLAAKLRA